MNYRSKLKLPAAVLGITVLVATAAMSTALAIRSHDTTDLETVAGAVASESLPTAADLGADTQQSIGIPEPLFIDGEPMIALDHPVSVQDLPDGTVSVSNPSDEPVSMPAVKPPPSPGIAVGEPHPDSSEPRLASSDRIEAQASSGSTGTAVTAVTQAVVNGSESDPVPVLDPNAEEIHAAPNPVLEEDVQGS